MKKVLAILVGLVMMAPLSYADEVADVKQLVANNIVIVVETMRNTDISRTSRNDKIIDTVAPFFSFDQMAKLSLGKKYWNALDKSQRTEFIDVFVDYLQRFFINSLEQYTDEDVKIASAKKVGKRIHVSTHLISGGETMELIFKFYKSRNGWLVYDIDILGVSIIHSKHSEIADKMKREGFDGLIKHFRESNGEA